MDQNSPQPPPPVPDDEIDLADLLRQLWAGKWIILVTTVIFVVCGIIYSVYKSSQIVNEYQSSVTLFAESPTPDSLLKVFSFPPFFTEVLETELTGLQAEGSLTVKQVLDEQIPPAGSIASLMNRITASVGNANTLVISVQMQDLEGANQLADSVVQKLTQFLKKTQIKNLERVRQLLVEDSLAAVQSVIETSGINIKNLTSAFRQAEAKYLKSQQALEDYYNKFSQNPGSIDTLYAKRLTADIELKYSVYSQLYQHLENDKMQEKETIERAKLKATNQIDKVNQNFEKQQPVITILEPATTASQVIVPKPFKIPLIMLFFGLLAGIGIVFGRKFYIKNFAGNNQAK